MPEEHKAVYAWSSERFLSWAEKNGPYTRELIKRFLKAVIILFSVIELVWEL